MVKWVEWGELKGVDYSGTAPAPAQDPQPEPAKKPTIRKGSKGTYVKECQNDLIKLGYDVGKTGADGKFGNCTDKAVRAFQKDKKLKVDGIVGAKTWEALDNAMGKIG